MQEFGAIVCPMKQSGNHQIKMSYMQSVLTWSSFEFKLQTCDLDTIKVS